MVEFLHKLCDTNTIRNVASDSMMMKIAEVEKHYKDRRHSVASSTSTSSTQTCMVHQGVEINYGFTPRTGACSCDSADSEAAELTYLEFLMDFVTQYEFPQKIVTFLLHLLPSLPYKVSVYRCKSSAPGRRGRVCTSEKQTDCNAIKGELYPKIELFLSKP